VSGRLRVQRDLTQERHPQLRRREGTWLGPKTSIFAPHSGQVA
jgi:hypothetical protein